MTRAFAFTNALGQGARTEIVPNRLCETPAPYGPAQQAILNDQAFAVARRAITAWPGYRPTPLQALPGLARATGVADIRFKDEGGRFGLGSFKALGGAYAVLRLLSREVARRKGGDEPTAEEILSGAHADVISGLTVCCATDGNHGRSVAWGARTFGPRCVIFIHATVSEGRRRAIEAYGAEVRRCAGNYDESVREADETAAREGWFVVSDTSYPGYTEVPKDVMQGYEIAAAEAIEQLDAPPTHLFLQTGVGGAAAALTAHIRRHYGAAAMPRIILCDPERSACWVESIRAGHPVAVTGDLDTLMAGLACGEVSQLAWTILSPLALAAVSVADADAVYAMRRLASPEPGDPAIVAGESAVAGLAAFLSIAANAEARAMLGLTDAARVMFFGTEGDTDPELYARLTGRTADEVRAQNER